MDGRKRCLLPHPIFLVRILVNIVTILHPRTKKVCKEPSRGWVFPQPKLEKLIEDGLIHFADDESTIPNIKTYLKKTEYKSLGSIKYRDSRVASKLLHSMFGQKTFSNPKDVDISINFIKAFQTDESTILDFFAGTGTTAHAVISLNRQDNAKRKYILVEQGDYFDTVLKPRIQKVVFSVDWKDGKATAPHTGISHAFKVLKIESYEDTLNNLQLRRTVQQQDLLDTLSQSAQEDYLLRYLLDIESRGSLLSVEQFSQPFDCKLKVAVDSAGAYEERTIDLVETFNYLIGLRVKHIDMQRDKGFTLVTGWFPTGEKTLVLWRDVSQVDYETLNRLCDKLAINPADSEFEIVYINGDHNIPAVFTSLETEGGLTKTLKIRQIEPEVQTGCLRWNMYKLADPRKTRKFLITQVSLKIHQATMRSNTATREFFVGLPGLGQTLSKSSLSAASAISRRTSEKAKLVRPFTLCRRSGSAFKRSA